MGRIIAIDYGKKRVGLAVTDPSRIIATALTSLSPTDLFSYLKAYFVKEQVSVIVVGMPKNLDNTDTDLTQDVIKLIIDLKKKFPSIQIETIDERFTSKIAKKSLVLAGLKKKKRQNKSLVDKVSAVLILQSYLSLSGS